VTTAHINRVATTVPDNDVHDVFVGFARSLLDDPRAQGVFDKMAQKAQIAHRYSCLPQDDAERVYGRGESPTTAQRMQLFEKHAAPLAVRTVGKLDLGADAARVSHLIVTSCTGMYAPGLDLDLVAECGLGPSVERTMVGFMGCYAAINALKLSRHIVRSDPDARVLVVNLELCSLHLQRVKSLEQVLSFLVFGDGCAAALVTADPVGLAMDRFHAALVPDTRGLITWKVRDIGFDMFLSGRVPGAISQGLSAVGGDILEGAPAAAIDLWAVHPGGRSVLDAVERGMGLAPEVLSASRRVLLDHGNMSSATVMFVLQRVMAAAATDQRGCAMSFGPGLTAETMLFHAV